MTFHPAQIEALLRPIKPHRVSQAQGMSHVEAWEIAAHLNRIFGFGNWEKHVTELALVHEASRPHPQKAEKEQWTVVYRCSMRLRIRREDGSWWENDDVATGDAQNQPTPGDAHDMAAKTAVSQALKRCAKDLGDQFGLSLYNNGSTKAVVGRVIGFDPTGDGPDVEAEAPAAQPQPQPQPEQPAYGPETGERLPPEGESLFDREDREAAARGHDAVMVSTAQLRKLFANTAAAGLADDDAVKADVTRWVQEHSGRAIQSRNELTSDEAEGYIDDLKRRAKERARGGAG